MIINVLLIKHQIKRPPNTSKEQNAKISDRFYYTNYLGSSVIKLYYYN